MYIFGKENAGKIEDQQIVITNCMVKIYFRLRLCEIHTIKIKKYILTVKQCNVNCFKI